jgi:hypothetical protein
MSLHLHVLSQLAASVPNPAPASPGVGGGAVTTLISWVKWLALAACATSAVVAGGMMAAGSTTRRSGMAERGKVALLWSVAGAVVVAIGIPLINQVFRLG